jgi:hypothetical protein
VRGKETQRNRYDWTELNIWQKEEEVQIKMTCHIKTRYSESQRKKKNYLQWGVHFNHTLYYSNTFYITISNNYFISLSFTYLH